MHASIHCHEFSGLSTYIKNFLTLFIYSAVILSYILVCSICSCWIQNFHPPIYTFPMRLSSWSSIPTLLNFLPLFISNTAPFFSPNDIQMLSENILIVWTRESSWSLFAPYNLRSSMNRRWLINVIFSWSLYPAFIFLSTIASGNMIITRVIAIMSLLGNILSWCHFVQVLMLMLFPS